MMEDGKGEVGRVERRRGGGKEEKERRSEREGEGGRRRGRGREPPFKFQEIVCFMHMFCTKHV